MNKKSHSGGALWLAFPGREGCPGLGGNTRTIRVNVKHRQYQIARLASKRYAKNRDTCAALTG